MTTTVELNKASKHLGNADPILLGVIERYGPCTLQPHDQYYQELVSSIVSQQLSVRAVQTIWNRFLDLFDGKMPSPEVILKTDDDLLRTTGISRPKISYIKDLASNILDGRLQIDRLPDLSNDEIIRELTAVKGLGVWSAHMFLIFSIVRLDVLAWGDLGVRKSAQRLYNLANLPTRDDLEDLSARNHWAPYQSVVCWYLWKNLDNKPTS